MCKGRTVVGRGCGQHPPDWTIFQVLWDSQVFAEAPGPLPAPPSHCAPRHGSIPLAGPLHTTSFDDALNPGAGVRVPARILLLFVLYFYFMSTGLV